MIVSSAHQYMSVARTSNADLRSNPRELRHTIANNLRAFRRSKRITQDRLAELCDLHRNYVGAVERGERNITLDTMARFADALGVTVPELLTDLSFGNET